MNRTGTRIAAMTAAAAALALVATACSSNTKTASASSGGGGSSAASQSPASTAVVHTASSPYGSILVDSRGKTIYGFAIDKPGKSNCNGVCLQYWPIVTAPSPLPSSIPGVSAKIGEITRTGGAHQLTLDGLPVYTYAGDPGPGTTSGQGKNLSGGLWWVLAPDGKWITKLAAQSSSASSGGGYGY